MMILITIYFLLMIRAIVLHKMDQIIETVNDIV